MNIIVLSIPNNVLRQLKVQRIYYFILAFWHVQVMTHFMFQGKETVEFLWFISGQKWKVERDLRLSSFESSSILLWIALGFSICHNIRYIWSWFKWTLVVWCRWSFTHTLCIFDDCRYLLTVLTHPRLVIVRYY